MADARERTAESGHYGGDPPVRLPARPLDAAKGQTTLTVVDAEAARIVKWAADVLAGVSMRSLARDMRASGIPTVTGAAWSPDTIRGILLAPVIAGLAQHSKPASKNDHRVRTAPELHPATWPAIIERDTWEAVTAILTDPARRTSPGNEPKWLVSGIAHCHCGETVSVRAASGRPSYVCRGPQAHLRRVAPALDAYISALVCERLSRPDARELLAPPPRPGCDAPALRREARRLQVAGERQATMHALGEITDSELRAGSRVRKIRLAEIDATLAASTAPDPLAEFRSADDVVTTWAALPVARKREVVRLLMSVTLERGRPGAPRRFDPASVTVRWLDTDQDRAA